MGNAYLFVGAEPHDVLKIILNLMLSYGDTVKFWFCNQFSLFISNLSDLEVILSTTKLMDKSMEYDVLKPWLREGLLLSKGRKWYHRRKILTPAFHFQILQDFVHIFNKQSFQMVQCLHAEMGKSNDQQQQQQIELAKWIHLVTLDVICGKLII